MPIPKAKKKAQAVSTAKRFIVTQALKERYPDLPDVGTEGAVIPSTWGVEGDCWLAKIESTDSNLTIKDVVSLGVFDAQNPNPVAVEYVYVCPISSLTIGSSGGSADKQPAHETLRIQGVTILNGDLRLSTTNCLISETEIANASVDLMHNSRIISCTIGDIGGSSAILKCMGDSFMQNVDVKAGSEVRVAAKSNATNSSFSGLSNLTASTLLNTEVTGSNIRNSYLQDCNAVNYSAVRYSTVIGSTILSSAVQCRSKLVNSSVTSSLIDGSEITSVTLADGSQASSGIVHSTVKGCYLAAVNASASTLTTMNMTQCAARSAELANFTTATSAYTSTALLFRSSVGDLVSLREQLTPRTENVLNNFDCVALEFIDDSRERLEFTDVQQTTVAGRTYTLLLHKDAHEGEYSQVFFIAPELGTMVTTSYPSKLLDEDIFLVRSLSNNQRAAILQAAEVFANNPAFH